MIIFLLCVFGFLFLLSLPGVPDGFFVVIFLLVWAAAVVAAFAIGALVLLTFIAFVTGAQYAF